MVNSKKLNEGIAALEEVHELTHDAPNEKPIPYIGWFWREVNFDAPRYRFGIIGETVGKPPALTGFMENNKWGYSTVLATSEQTAEIRRLLEAAVAERSVAAVRAARDAIVAVGATKRVAKIAHDEYGFDETVWGDVP